MSASRGEIESAATERWGQPNKGLSSRDELRFGNHGSVSVKLDTNEWYDHENTTGGLVLEKTPEVIRVRLCVAKYNYVDEQGNPHIQVLRYMPKDFRQRRPDPNNPDKWIWSVKGIKQVPYNLTEILKSDYVFVCEGEKDADNLTNAGLVATTNAQGANKWPDELTQYFNGKDVYVLPDNDQAGRDHAKLVGNKLYGNCNSVRIVDVCRKMLPRSDISDWLNENNASELIGLAQGFESVASVVGPSNCGKTFFMSDLCLHVALGKSWRGREVDAGGVLFVAAEGAYGIRNRIAAYKQHNNLTDSIPMTILPSSINMLDAEADVQKLIRTIQFKAQELGNISLIVLDTLARVMAGGNENAAEDMSLLVVNCDKISQTTGAHVCLIHHSGKDETKGSRGSSSLRAAVSSEIEIKKSGEISVATVTKQREMEIDGEFAFKLEVVDIGINDRGKKVTSCVVQEVDNSHVTEKRKRSPRGANPKILLKAMKQLGASGRLQTLPVKVNGFELPADCKGISVDDFYVEAKGKISCESKHKRTRFNDAISSLVGDEFIGLEDDYLWLIP